MRKPPQAATEIEHPLALPLGFGQAPFKPELRQIGRTFGWEASKPLTPPFTVCYGLYFVRPMEYLTDKKEALRGRAEASLSFYL